jgi:hypothetical protein
MIESTSSLQREEEVSGAQDFLNQRNRIQWLVDVVNP